MANMEEGKLLNKQLLKRSFFKKKSFFHTLYMRGVYSIFYNFFISMRYISLSVRFLDRLIDPPFIVCSNHSSHSDSIILMFALGGCFDQYCLLAAQDYWYRDIFPCWLARTTFNMLPVSRTTRNHDSFTFEDTVDVMKPLVEQNKKFIIYPEGGRSSSGVKASVRPFKSGASRFAMTLNLPILPVFIEGAIEAMGKGSFFVKPGSFYKVSIGEAIFPQKFSRPKEMIQEVEWSVRGLQKESSKPF